MKPEYVVEMIKLSVEILAAEKPGSLELTLAEHARDCIANVVAEHKLLKAENAKLRQSLAYLEKYPEECVDEGGICVSHSAYIELTEQLEAAGWRWDDEKDCWVPPEVST